MDFVYLDICGAPVSNMLVYIQKMGINRTDYKVIVKNDSTVQKVFSELHALLQTRKILQRNRRLRSQSRAEAFYKEVKRNTKVS